MSRVQSPSPTPHQKYLVKTLDFTPCRHIEEGDDSRRVAEFEYALAAQPEKLIMTLEQKACGVLGPILDVAQECKKHFSDLVRMHAKLLYCASPEGLSFCCTMRSWPRLSAGESCSILMGCWWTPRPQSSAYGTAGPWSTASSPTKWCARRTAGQA